MHLFLLRKLSYFVCGAVMLTALTFSILYSMTMDGHAVNQWIGAQIMSIIADILLMPFIRVTLITITRMIFGCNHDGARESIYSYNNFAPRLLSDRQRNAHFYKSPREILDSRANRVAKYLARQAIATKEMIVVLCTLVVKAICLYLIYKIMMTENPYHVYQTSQANWADNIGKTVYNISTDAVFRCVGNKGETVLLLILPIKQLRFLKLYYSAYHQIVTIKTISKIFQFQNSSRPTYKPRHCFQRNK